MMLKEEKGFKVLYFFGIEIYLFTLRVIQLHRKSKCLSAVCFLSFIAHVSAIEFSLKALIKHLQQQADFSTEDMKYVTQKL